MNDQPPGSPSQPGQAVSGFYVVLPPVEESTGVPVAEILRSLRDRWRRLLVATFLGAFAGLALFFVMRPVYRADIVTVPTAIEKEEGVLSSLATQFGDLAGLGGLQLGNQGNEVAEAVAVLTSRKFLGDFIVRENLLPALFPDDWKADVPVGGPKQVTLQDGIERFLQRVMLVDVESPAMFVTVRIDWYDRELAAEWANKIIDDLNSTMRARAVQDSQRNIEFLQKELTRTEAVPIQQSLYRLVEEEMRRAMLASTRADYVLRVIDPATPPDEDRYIRPSWPLLILGGAFIGLAIAAAAVIVLSRELRHRDRSAG